MKIDKKLVKELEASYSRQFNLKMVFVGAFETPKTGKWCGFAFLKNAEAEYPKVMLEVYDGKDGYSFLPSLVEHGVAG